MLSGCSTQQPQRHTGPLSDDHSRFEAAIAEKILGDAVSTVPHLPASQRLNYLQDYLSQFERGVDQSRISNRLQREGELLRYVTQAEVALQMEFDLRARVRQLSSLEWAESEFEDRFNHELQRIDQRLLAHSNHREIQPLILNQRATAAYPDDSPHSKQQYLDDLSTEMLGTQADWHDLLIEYAPSVLAITGHETPQGTTFTYENQELAINLSQTEDLPTFEIQCLAAFYGYPGLQAFPITGKSSIKMLLDLPGYTHGWASYVVDLISETPEGQPCLWYSRLQGTAAIADLNLNRGYWDEATALEYLYDNAPYSRSRLSGVINEIVSEPGRYVSLFAGRLYFRDLMAGCQTSNLNQCAAEVHQKIINLGPIPFPMLSNDLNKMNGFTPPSKAPLPSVAPALSPKPVPTTAHPVQ